MSDVSMTEMHRGLTYIFETGVDFAVFGHFMYKLCQLFELATIVPQFTLKEIVFYRRMFTSYVAARFTKAMISAFTHVIEFIGTPYIRWSDSQIRCYSNASLGWGHEIMFTRNETANKFRSLMYASEKIELHDDWKDSCVLLQRKRGSAPRAVLNADEVTTMMRDFCKTVRHIKVDDTWSLRDQIYPFSNHQPDHNRFC